VVDIIGELQSYGINLTIYDPIANPGDVKHEYGLDIVNALPEGAQFDSVLLAVAHTEFKTTDWRQYANERAVIYDVKSCLDRSVANARL
jgi:UDP-N-acetyl-D-galactosamine dehydrogenase